MFSRHPRSPPSSTSAPVATTFPHFSSTRRVEISGYLTQKVPPKPQQVPASRISVSLSPSTDASSVRGWSRTSISRRPAQESWYVAWASSRASTARTPSTSVRKLESSWVRSASERARVCQSVPAGNSLG